MRNLFVPIVKIDEDQRVVIGRATVEEIDSQGEVVSFEASKAAFETWTKQFEKATDGESLGNIREMHQSWAAGKVTAWDAEKQDKSILIATKIVDDDAWLKAKERVYTGFSIGGNPTEEGIEEFDGQKVNVIRAYDLVEVSLVDNPASPSSTFNVVKEGSPSSRPLSMSKFLKAAPARKGRVLSPLEACVAVVRETKRQAIALAKQDGDTETQPPADDTLSKPAALDACVATLVAEGQDESAAFAICTEAQKVGGEEATAEQLTELAHEALGKESTEVDESAGTETEPTPEAAESETEIAAVAFHPDHFTLAQATEWAVTHGHRVAYHQVRARQKVNEIVLSGHALPPNITFEKAVPMFGVKGVTLLIGKRSKQSKALHRVMVKLRKNLTSEGFSMAMGMRALEGIQAAIDSEIMTGGFEPGAELADEEKAAVMTLTSAAEAILEFMAGELQQQLRAVSGGSGGLETPAPAEAEGMEMCQRLIALQRALSPRQLAKQEDDEELMENLTKIHEIGHSLAKATLDMGAECPGGVCKQDDDDDDAAPAEGEGEGEGEGNGDDDDAEGKGRMVNGVWTNTSTPKSPQPNRLRPYQQGDATRVLQAVQSVKQMVQDLKGSISGFDGRLRKQEQRPAEIGRAVTSPAKVLGGPEGSGHSTTAMSEQLTELADNQSDPKVAEALRRQAVTLTVKDIHREARRR